MSGPDRIPVSGNGHRPPLEAEPTASSPEPSPSPDSPSAPGGPTAPDEGFASRPGLAMNATPAQLAVGLGIVASLLLLALGARRRRR